MNIFVATTMHGGAHRNFLDAFARLGAMRRGWQWHGESGDGIGAARDRCVGEFLKTKCDGLLFWDADVGSDCIERDVDRIVSHDVDIVSGCYPLKQDGKPCLVICPVPGAVINQKNGLQECEAVGTGFLYVRRDVFTEFCEATPELAYRGPGGDLQHHYFNSCVEDGELYGEDIWFCRRARKLGFKVFADYGIRLTHSGNKVFRCLPEEQTTTQPKQ